MPYLNWINDEDLIQCTRHLLEVAEVALLSSQQSFHRNVIDPFSALFQMGGFGIDHNTWVKAEETRQSEKTLQNHIGSFHQKILGSVDNWVDTGTGGFIDVRSDQQRIIAEIKNKHNTVTGSALVVVYDNLEELVMPRASVYHGFTSYYVTIIPNRPRRFNAPFTPSNRKTGERRHANELIRLIDGASFYHLVTGEEFALSQLFGILPQVVDDIRGTESLNAEDRAVLLDLYRRAYA